MIEIQLEELQREVRKELKKLLTQEDIPTYQKGLKISRIKKEGKKLLENEKIKKAICSKSFRSVYELADLIAKTFLHEEIAGLIITGEPTLDYMVLLIAFAAKMFTDQIDLDEYCR